MLGERLSQLVSFEALKLAAAVVLLAPYTPMLFMGEEYGENAPFLYFVSHGDPGLVEAVRKGRKLEFEAFHAQGTPPDPQAMDTFLRSKLSWEKRDQESHKTLLAFYQHLLNLRKRMPALATFNKENIEVTECNNVICMKRHQDNHCLLCIFCFCHQNTQLMSRIAEDNWEKILDSSESKWNGPGSLLPQSLRMNAELTLAPWSASVYSKD